MLPKFRLAAATILPVVSLFFLLSVNAGAQAPTTPPMMVQVPYISVGAGDVVAGVWSTSKASGCTGYANAGSNNYGDGCPANQVGVSAPWGVVADAWGNVYFSDEGHLEVRVIYAGATTVNGVANPATAMIPAANATLVIPETLVAGDVYALAGGLTAVMSGTCNGGGSSINTNGSGCPATDSYIKGPYSPAVDSAGNVFIPDKSNSLVYVVLANATGLAAQLVAMENSSTFSTCTTVSSALTCTGAAPQVGFIYQIVGSSGGWTDNALANNTGKMHAPYSVAVDASENLYIADETNDVVRMVNGPNNSTSGGVAAGYIHTIAGAGNCGTASCTGTPTPLAASTAPSSNLAALGAKFSLPGAVVVDGSGNVYIADNSGGTASVYTTVRVIYAGGTNNPLANLIKLETGVSSPTANYVYTLAGDGIGGSSGKGAGLLATASGVVFDRIEGLGLDSHGNIYVMDYGSHSELAEINANTGILTFLSADGLPTAGTAFLGANVYCSSGTGTGSGPMTLDKYGDGCPAPQSFTSNAEGNIGIDPSGNLYYADNGNNLIRKLSFNNSFPATTVGSPAPTQNLAFVLFTGNTGDTVTSGTMADSVTTQGITTGSEFAKAVTGDSCGGTTTLAAFASGSTNVANDVCIIPVTFTPKYAGARSGAVNITGTIGSVSTLLGTVYLNGTGNGAELAVDPGTSSTLGSGSEPTGVATDSAGNVYVAYENGTIYRTPNNGGTPVEIASGLFEPQQVAIDGAGNLYVANSGSDEIVEFAGASTSSSVITGTPIVSGLTNTTGIAVDASGNLYIAEAGKVLLQPVVNGAQTVLGSGFAGPVTLAVDSSGNVYVVDVGHLEIEKMTITNGVVTQQSKVTILFNAYPINVAVDAAGNIYYGDGNSGNIVEVTVSGTTEVVASGFTNPIGLALDPTGNLYVADSSSSSGIGYFNRAAATLPAIPKERSGDAMLTNVGNVSYSGGIASNSDVNSATDFTFAAGSSNGCNTPGSFSLVAGYNCDLNVTANTSTATDTITFTGGSTLALSSQASEVIGTVTALSVNNPSVPYGTAITGTVTVTPNSGSLNPTGTVTLLANGSTTLGSCNLSNAAGNTSSCSFSLSNVNAGTPMLTASYGGDSNSSSSVSIGTQLTIAQVTTTTTLGLSGSSSMTEGNSFTGTVSVSPSTATAESISVYVDGSGTAATTCSLSSGSCSWTLSGLAIGGHSLTASYPGSSNYAASSTVGSTSISVTAPPQATAVATGDTRTVTEPTFPAVCQQLSAALTSANDDLPASVDATTSNPDGARIQAALNSCAGSGQAVKLSVDGTGVFNAFLTGPLSMPSNVTLLVDPGVYVYFSRNAQDYDKVAGTHTCGTVNSSSATSSCRPLIDIPGTSTNVGIMGFGKLDGRGGDVLLNAISPYGGQSWWGLSAIANSGGNQQNPRFIQMDTGASNITLYKITLRNSPLFHVSTTGAVTGFTAWDIKIITPTSSRNTDGIDPGNAQNFTITRSWISDGDDNIAVGAAGTTAPAANISVTNNHFFAGHGESIGSYTGAGVSNVLFDGNMLSGNGTAGSGSAVSGTGSFTGGIADSNSTGLRIKSGFDRGGLVTNIQYSNSCFQYHKAEIVFSPNYENTTGSLSPNINNILLQNLSFLTAGTAQLTGTSNNGTVYPLQLALDNVSFPGAYPSTEFSPAPTNTALTYGPGLVSPDFVADFATFAGSNGNTATNNSTVSALFPPACNFTYIAPELTGPAGLPQTITQGQNTAAVVILTPTVGGAAYPTGTVTLTDALTSDTYTATLPGTTDTISIPLIGLAAGTHTFTATYSGDSNYTLTGGQTVYSTTAPYVITVNAGSLASTTTSLGLPVLTSVTSSFGTAVTATATISGTNPSGSVQFIVSGGGLTGSNTYSTVALVSGAASASISLPYSGAAIYSITAVYSGDSTNAGSTSSPASLTVGAATTQTTLAVNTASAALGKPLILTVTVTSSVGTPTAANVTFAYSTTISGAQTPLGTATLSNGATTYFLNSLPVGSYYFFASYAGSSSYGASNSVGIPAAVTAATIIPLPSYPIALPYTMTTIAGGGAAVASSGNMACTGATDKYGDGCQASAIAFTASDDMRAVVADPFGNVYLSDTSAALVRRIAPNGVITNFAGKVSGTACVPSATTGCTPTLVTLGKARGVGTDAAGNIYIANYTGNQVFEIKVSNGLLYLVAGNGTAGSSGDGSAAASAEVNNPRGVWGDTAGNIYIADTADNKIRVVDSAGNIHTFAGAGGTTSTGDGAPATAANFDNPQGVIVDANLNVYVTDAIGRVRVICVSCGTSSPLDNLLQAVGATTTLNSATNGYIYTIAGSGSAAAYTGTYPILSTSVSMAPQKLAFDTVGNLYISDSNGFIWFLDLHTGYIRAIAKNGTVCGGASSAYGYAALGDGCPATQASFGSNGGNGMGVGTDALGNLYISDSTNLLIRKMITGLAFPSTAVNATTTQSALIHAPSTQISLSWNPTSDWSAALPNSVNNADGTTDVPIAFSLTPKVPGLRSTPLTASSNGNTTYLGLAGIGSGAGATLDPASQISFGTNLSVAGLATDNAGNVYVSDATSRKVLRFASSVLTQGSSATSTTLATLTAPGAVAVDPRGYVYAADTSTGLITQITPAGASSTLPFAFTTPAGLAVDPLDNLYVSDSSTQAVYQINLLTGTERNLNLGTLVSPKGLTIDPFGNLLVADPGAPAIYRFNPSGTRTTVTTSAVAPSSVLTDAAGNLLIGDTAKILAVPASANSSSFTVAGLAPSALAIDSAGNLYTGSGGGVLKLLRTQGYVQYAGPAAPSKTVSMLDSGNQALTLSSLGQTDTSDYSLTATASTDCTLSGGLPSALAVGGVCAMTASYTPTTFQTTTDTVTFNGNPQNAALSTPSSVQLTLTGPATPPTSGITITSFSPASPTFGQSVTVYATVTGATPLPTGNVAFYVDGSSTAAASGTVNGSGVASATLAGLTGGAHTVSATYTSTNGYAASSTSSASSLSVAKANPTLAWTTPVAITYGTALSGTQLNASATGVTGATLLGQFTYTPLSGTVLTAGAQTLSVSFAPNDTTDYTTPATTTVHLQVNKASSSISLAPSLNPILLQNPVTYTATVTSTAGKPTGTVTFSDGGVAISACTGVTVTTASGLASCAVTYTVTGSHSITAAYSGDVNFLTAGPSNTVSEAAIDISLGAPTAGGGISSTGSILPGGTVTYTFPIAPSSGTSFPLPVTFTVSSVPTLPAGTTMTLTPAAWSLTSNNPWTWTLPATTALTGNTVLTIQLPQSAAAMQPDLFKQAPFALALLLLPFVGRLRKSGKRLGRMLAIVLLAGAGAAALAGVSGCGSNIGFFDQAQKSYSVTVTVGSGSLSHTSNTTLIIE